MGRWSQYDEDSYRLPEGMTRIGYDADTERYTYRDSNGQIYEGAPGARYGTLRPVGQRSRMPEPDPADDSDASSYHVDYGRLSKSKSDNQDKGGDDDTMLTQWVIAPIQSLHRSLTQKVSSAVDKTKRRSSASNSLQELKKTTNRLTRRSTLPKLQSPRDYLLNGEDPEKTMMWLKENRAPRVEEKQSEAKKEKLLEVEPIPEDDEQLPPYEEKLKRRATTTD